MKKKKMIEKLTMMMMMLSLTSLALHVDGLVSLNEDGHGALGKVEIRLIHERRSPHQSVIIPFHPKSVIPHHARPGYLNIFHSRVSLIKFSHDTSTQSATFRAFTHTHTYTPFYLS